jgi:hypothetical protein
MTDKEALKLALEALENVESAMYVTSEGEAVALEKVNKAIAAIKEALAQPVQEPEYWNVIDPAGNVVASETDAIRGWARIAGSYKPTVEGLLGFHEQGWRVLPKVTPPMPEQARNFCPRCGKRTADPTTIHTCTPPVAADS